MKWCWRLAVLLLLVLTSACTSPHQKGLQQARIGLNKMMSQLPTFSQYPVVTTITGESVDVGRHRTCYYAEAYIVVGVASLPEEVLKAYTSYLLRKGWIIDREEENFKILTRGESEMLILETGHHAGWAIESNEEYQRAKGKYPLFLYITVRYILPAWEGC